MTNENRSAGSEPALNAESAIARLRAHADDVEGGWIPGSWESNGRGGQLRMGTQENHFGRVGVFDGLPVEAGRTVTATTRLDLPATLHHVDLVGEPLFLTADGTYPIDVFVAGRRVFGDHLPVVASGPALIQAIDELVAGDNGELRFDIDFSNAAASGNGPHLSISVRMTTPGLIRRHELVDLSYARLLLAANLAQTEAEHQAVDRAVALVPEDVAALTGVELEELATDLRVALALVAPRVEAFNVHCVAHAHIDLAWLWTWSDTKEVIKRDIRSMLGLMEEFKDFHYTHSQPATYALLEAEEPELFAAVRERIAEGRWEPATMQWVEGDTNMASGPAQSRQLLEAVAYSREHLGVQPDVFLAPDTFGHAGNIPQLATSAGARTYYHHRGNPGQVSGGKLWPVYWWEGDEGSRILAVSTPVYLGALTAGRVARDVLALGHEVGLSEVCYFYGAGDHGGGPTRQSFERLVALQDQPGLPRLASSTVGNYSRALLATAPNLPVHHGESITVFEGCYTSHADTKRWNRDGENLLVSAETLSAVAGVDAVNELSEAWRLVLFNQFHDILDGSAVHEAYRDNGHDFEKARVAAERVTASAIDRLAQDVPAAAEWAVTNPLGVDRRDVVEITDAPGGHLVAVDAAGVRYPTQRTAADTIVFVAAVPALATVGFRLEPAVDVPPSLATATVEGKSYPGAQFLTVDTDYFYAQVREDCGVITTLFDKRSGRELVGYASARGTGVEQVRPDLGMAVLQVLHEYPHEMSSWVIDEVYEERSLIRGSQAAVVESGPVRLVIEAAHQYQASKLTSRLVFYADLPRIDVELEVDWQEEGGPDAGVPGAVISFGSRLDGVEAWYETPFAASRRPADGLVVPALRWADIGNDDYGIAVLNDGKYGHDALGSRLRVHLVRSSYEPDPSPEADRVDRTRLAIYPHAGSWRQAGVVAEAAGFNQPLRVTRRPQSPAEVVSQPALFRPIVVGSSTAVIAGLRHAKDHSGRVVGLYESAGKAANIVIGGLPPYAEVWELSTAGDRGRSHRVGGAGELGLGLQPYEVRDLLVEESYLQSDAVNETASAK